MRSCRSFLLLMVLAPWSAWAVCPGVKVPILGVWAGDAPGFHWRWCVTARDALLRPDEVGAVLSGPITCRGRHCPRHRGVGTAFMWPAGKQAHTLEMHWSALRPGRPECLLRATLPPGESPAMATLTCPMTVRFALQPTGIEE